MGCQRRNDGLIVMVGGETSTRATYTFLFRNGIGSRIRWAQTMLATIGRPDRGAPRAALITARAAMAQVIMAQAANPRTALNGPRPRGTRPATPRSPRRTRPAASGRHRAGGGPALPRQPARPACRSPRRRAPDGPLQNRQRPGHARVVSRFVANTPRR